MCIRDRFKALLFLGAGCIIHAVHSNEMSAMGGLRRHMPVTHATFLVACLAIAGIWPLSGFFSKDEILSAAFAFSPVMGWTMTFIAGLTAFYMFRLYYNIFWGRENRTPHDGHAPHEAPATMILPLVFLALVTLGAGWIPFGEFVSRDVYKRQASGWACDVRKRHPYAMYGKVDFEEVLFTEGDCFARYMVRMREIEQSMRIIEQLIDNIPQGEFRLKMKPVIRIPEGSYYTAVEGSRGEFGVFIESRGDKSPYRMKFRSTGLPLVSCMETVARGAKIADLIAIGGTVDYVVPDIDR